MNVGPTIASRLKEVGIHTADDLRSVGAVGAYQRIRAIYSGKTIPVCYYLYSLEGALRGRHWDALPSRIKQSLLSQVSPETRRQRQSVTRLAKRKRRATLPRR
jgi:DNA transformation protein